MSTAWRSRLVLLTLIGGIGLLLHAAYLPAKAWLAQHLLEQAWQRRLAGQPAQPPWPGADMRPLARLQQPRLAVTQVVLNGASGRVLAFGPGHVTGSALPGEHGNIVISGHRDTHFHWLRELQDGDLLTLESGDGTVRGYAVHRAAVHQETEIGLLDPLADDQLRLFTCYPFDGLYPGTPLRYVVTALPLAM